MSTFKDTVEADIMDVFLNLDEFAETHEVEGVEVIAVLSVNQTKQKSERENRNFDGLHGDFGTLYVKKDALPRVPKHNENIRLDSKRYKVERCREDMGVLRIDLSAYRMGGAG